MPKRLVVKKKTDGNENPPEPDIVSFIENEVKPKLKKKVIKKVPVKKALLKDTLVLDTKDSVIDSNPSTGLPTPDAESIEEDCGFNIRDVDPVSEYLLSLNERELKTMRIAEDHLESSFCMEKSGGYLEFHNK